MSGDNYFYRGGLYGPSISESVTEDYGLKMEYNLPASQFGPTTDARTANQLKAVSDKISTGAKTIEVTAIDANTLDYIPKQHLDEINKLKKLAGVELTFHGPLIEPTGISKQGWDETQRQESERKIINAVEKGHQLDPDGNIVVTFHSGVINVEPEQRVWDEKRKKEITTDIWFVDKESGNFGNIPLMQKKYFPGEEREPGDKEKAIEEIKKKNEENWDKELQNLNYHAYQGAQIIEDAIKFSHDEEAKLKKAVKKPEILFDYYKNYGTPEAQEDIRKVDELTGGLASDKINKLTHGNLFIREAYDNLKKLFNDAYAAVEKDPSSKGDRERLENYKKEIAPLIKDLEDPKNVDKLANEIIKGVNILRTIQPPQKLSPMRDFMIEKAADTFSNAAIYGYNKFKDTSPIISIENPPAGTAPLSRAEDLKELIEKSQEKFIEKAQEKFHMTREQAKKQAEKIIGATWDVGHINMIRRFGFSEKDVVKESKMISPHLKHIHLSDNFGMEHTELPMGMGNVPIKDILKLNDKFRKAKKIIETGGWYKDFKVTPLKETLSAFGSPIYAMKMAPAWNQSSYMSAGYFAGYGMNPEFHHSIYGAGFTGLPVSLGGQVEGRSRLSGTPME